jgi:hypothetical protein
MSDSGALELLTDASGSVTFGWLDAGVFYARFNRCLSARLGEAFVARLRAAVSDEGALCYFGDARALESYDLRARSAFVKLVGEQRRRFAELLLLTWPGDDETRLLTLLGEPARITGDPLVFERSLFAAAPRARRELAHKPEIRSRWPLRR